MHVDAPPHRQGEQQCCAACVPAAEAEAEAASTRTPLRANALAYGLGAGYGARHSRPGAALTHELQDLRGAQARRVILLAGPWPVDQAPRRRDFYRSPAAAGTGLHAAALESTDSANEVATEDWSEGKLRTSWRRASMFWASWPMMIIFYIAIFTFPLFRKLFLDPLYLPILMTAFLRITPVDWEGNILNSAARRARCIA